MRHLWSVTNLLQNLDAETIQIFLPFYHHLFSCISWARKYLARSVPICLLITLANWNLAQVHGVQIYPGQFDFLWKSIKEVSVLSLLFYYIGARSCLRLFSVSWRHLWGGSFQKIWPLSGEEAQLPCGPLLFRSQFMTTEKWPKQAL